MRDVATAFDGVKKLPQSWAMMRASMGQPACPWRKNCLKFTMDKALLAQPLAVTPDDEPCAPGALVALSLPLALSACGGSGGADPTTPPASTDPVVLPPLPAAEQAARFLGQAAWGGNDTLVAELVGANLNWSTWLDAQIAKPARSTTAADIQDMTAWQLALAAGFARAEWQAEDIGLDNVLWFRLLSSDDILRQRLVLTWSEIFVVSQRNMPIPWGHFACLAYWDTLEAHCWGTFRELVEAVTLSPAMGAYLSMRGSRKADPATGRRPDENYARELLQLFSIGLVPLDASGQPTVDAQGRHETYTNTDVSELARALTGWDFDSDPAPDYTPATTPAYTARPMVPNEAWHDTDAKTVLGESIPAGQTARDDLKSALDIVCAHPNVGPFIARQLIQKLVCSNPDAAHVRRVAAVFADNGQGVRGDLAAVVKAVLLDPMARDRLAEPAASSSVKLREPLLRFIQWARLVQLKSTAQAGVDDPRDLWDVGDLSAASRLGQSPLRSPSVFNFFRPGYVPPQSGLSEQGLVAPEFQLVDESSVIGYVNFMLSHRAGAPDQKMEIDLASWYPLASNPAQLVDRFNLLLTGRTLSTDTLDTVTAAVASLPDNPEDPTDPDLMGQRVELALLLLMCSPDYLVQR
jgi:uncharacterized protein (DUF1800 family)